MPYEMIVHIFSSTNSKLECILLCKGIKSINMLEKDKNNSDMQKEIILNALKRTSKIKLYTVLKVCRDNIEEKLKKCKIILAIFSNNSTYD